MLYLKFSPKTPKIVEGRPCPKHFVHRELYIACLKSLSTMNFSLY